MMSYMFEGDIGDKEDKGDTPEISQVTEIPQIFPPSKPSGLTDVLTCCMRGILR
jgi:hypothetical protein